MRKERQHGSYHIHHILVSKEDIQEVAIYEDEQQLYNMEAFP